MSETVPLAWILADPSDDEQDNELNTMMQRLVDGEVEAAAAAKEIDALIVNDCQQERAGQYESIRNNQDSPGNDGNGNIATPSGWVPHLWRTVGKVAIAVPHHHAGQDRLVRFIQELQRLPSRIVSFISPHGEKVDYNFWEDSRNGEEFCQEMRLLDSGQPPSPPPFFVLPLARK